MKRALGIPGDSRKRKNGDPVDTYYLQKRINRDPRDSREQFEENAGPRLDCFKALINHSQMLSDLCLEKKGTLGIPKGE